MTRSAAHPFDGRARLALIVAIVAMAAGGVGFRSAVGWLNVALRKEPVPLRRHLAEVPRRLGDWEATDEDLVLDAASVEELGTDQYLNRLYVGRDGDFDGQTLIVHVAYYTGMIDAVPHIPERCFVAAGWDPVSGQSDRELAVRFPDARTDESGATFDGEPYRTVEVRHPVTGRYERVRLPFGDPQLRTQAFGRPDEPGDVVYGGFFFIANHRITPSPEAIRASVFNLSARHAYFAKVQLQMRTDAQDDPELFTDMSSDLLQHLLPHLMRCLPDWAEVEAGTVGSHTT